MEETTLLFRHLPSELSKEEREDLLYYLGAKRIQVMGRYGAMKNTAFAVFPNKAEASKVVRQLHQVEFLGSKLIVEFAHKTQGPSVVDNEGLKSKEDKDGEIKKDSDSDLQPEVKPIKFDDTFNIWGLNQPRRPDLCYLYPPPTPTTLTNIMHALAAVPKFYVQVLHLMNKMDLPAPFGAVTSAPPVRPDVHGYTMLEDRSQREMEISSESESEMDSDGEKNEARLKQQHPEKYPMTSTRRRDRKRKRPRLSDLQDAAEHTIHTNREPAAQVKDVFDQADVAAVSSRKIDLKLPSAIFTHKVPPSLNASGTLSFPATILPIPVETPTAAVPSLSNAGKHYEKTTSIEHDQPQQSIVRSQLQQKSNNLQDLPTDFVSSNKTSHYHVTSESLYSAEGSKQIVLSSDTELLVIKPPHDTLSPSCDSYDVSLPPQIPGRSSAPKESIEPPKEDSEAAGGFGLLRPVAKSIKAEGSDEETAEKEWTKGKFISFSELRKKRLSQSEMKDCSVFRRYNAGEPSCRLYIKNLAKQVIEDDIHWIFGRYMDWDDETQKNIFDIRLMKEGRMKGQAFVTLPSEDAAGLAVRDTNGFILKEKPMVVQFARSAKIQEDEVSKP